MSGNHRSLGCVASSLIAMVLFGGGCPSQPGGDSPPGATQTTANGGSDGAGQTNNSSSGSGTNDGSSGSATNTDCETVRLLKECGTRAVADVPAHVYIEQVTQDSESTIQPTDAPLAKVLFGTELCSRDGDNSPGSAGSRTLYEVGDNGDVLASLSLNEILGEKVAWRTPLNGWRFVIEDGCLALEAPHTNTILDPNNFAQDSPCGCGAFPLGRNGAFVLVDPNQPYICIRIEVQRYCRDCRHDAEAWHETLTSTISYVAEDALDGVSTAGYAEACGGEATVNIPKGDRVTVTQAETIEYRLSPSPIELGYSLSSMPNDMNGLSSLAHR